MSAGTYTAHIYISREVSLLPLANKLGHLSDIRELMQLSRAAITDGVICRLICLAVMLWTAFQKFDQGAFNRSVQQPMF